MNANEYADAFVRARHDAWIRSEVQRIAPHLANAMLEAWAPTTPMPDPGRQADFADLARTEVAIAIAQRTKCTANAVISERRAHRPAWPMIQCYSGASLAFRVHEGPVEHARLRAAAADPSVTPDWIDVREALHRGQYGGVVVTLRYFVPANLDPAGDLGGPGDHMVAEAARAVTKQTEPTKVCQALAEMMPAESWHTYAPDHRKNGMFRALAIAHSTGRYASAADVERYLSSFTDAKRAAAAKPMPVDQAYVNRMDVHRNPTLTIEKAVAPHLTRVDIEAACGPDVEIDGFGMSWVLTFPEGTSHTRAHDIVNALNLSNAAYGIWKEGQGEL